MTDRQIADPYNKVDSNLVTCIVTATTALNMQPTVF